MIEEKCEKCKLLSFKIQLGGTVFLTVLKLIFGLLGNSAALLADALHCTSNVVTSFAIVISRWFSNRPADGDYPYGYGKIEYIISTIVCTVIIAGTISLVIASLKSLFYEHIIEPPKLYVIFVAIISILINELLYGYLQCVGKRFNSSVLLANSSGIRADSLTSLAVIISVVAARLGFQHLDGIIALAVAMTIIWTSGKYLFHSIHCLMDRSISPQHMLKIKSHVERFTEAKIKAVQARFVGSKIWTNVDIEVDENYTVEHFNNIASQIRQVIYTADSAMEKVFVNYVLRQEGEKNVRANVLR